MPSISRPSSLGKRIQTRRSGVHGKGVFAVQDIAASAVQQGLPADRVQGLLAGIAPDRSVLPLLDQQPEFSTPIWDYLAGLVDAQRISDGQQRLASHAVLLEQVQRDYGVDPATVVAVWGVESDYGRIFGKRPLLLSLATLSCEGRRQPFFRSELLALLKLISAGDLSADGLTGSWAGAFGHTQFMPSTYARIAVDGDGDGRRDLVASIPDALASTANYLKRAGWRSGQPWGIEVTLPAGFNPALAGRTKRQPLSQWRALQQLLLARGHPIGEADGMIGTATRRAIAAEQARLGWTNTDGRAGQKILDALKGEAQISK